MLFCDETGLVTLKEPFVVENEVDGRFATGHVQLPELMVVPNQGIVARNRKLKRFARNQISKLKTGGGFQQQ